MARPEGFEPPTGIEFTADLGLDHLIRDHIHREEEELYPLADKLLDESKQKEIRLACQKLEEKMGKQWLSRMMDILKQLSAAYPGK